jgi:hypothetical protein
MAACILSSTVMVSVIIVKTPSDERLFETPANATNPDPEDPALISPQRGSVYF